MILLSICCAISFVGGMCFYRKYFQGRNIKRIQQLVYYCERYRKVNEELIKELETHQHQLPEQEHYNVFTGEVIDNRSFN